VQIFRFFLVLIVAASGAPAQTSAVRATESIVREVVEKSFPELRGRRIEVRSFESESDYFKARFAIADLLAGRKMRYLIGVNAEVFEKGAPAGGIRAIVAHELAHVLYYASRKRLQLIGLTRLLSGDFTRDFERRADLIAIARGYGQGLGEYRKWLYKNIPAEKVREKKRKYFSPDEIEIILEILKEKPLMMERWLKNVPHRKEELSS
jgi:hypothetical protein